MEVESYTMARKKAADALADLRGAFKVNLALKKEHALTDMQKVYGHMSHHGGAVIDVPASLKTAGLNADGDPKLAIIRADYKVCYLFKRDNGRALISGFNNTWNRPLKKDGDIYTPRDTYTWKKDTSRNYGYERAEIQAPVPLIPPAILIDEVKHSLKNYHILWEVEKWDHIPPKDPMLLKQLTPNLFGVLATWDLTPLERAIIKGRL
jgi:hypothetical protein